mmetsp:Transcript_8884/g.17543  ORF Transcript_8884/g.17543 Transcript_8884/m.17543 type:complete len:228 (+) Transcript_8884:77-760(+)
MMAGFVDPEACSLPDLKHLRMADYEFVYEPSDDTYLLVDTLHSEKALLDSLRPALAVELGVGSGCVSTALSTLLSPPPGMIMVDINPVAAATAVRTAEYNQVFTADAVICDLDQAFAMEGKIDVLLFNPPYVVTPTEEISESLIARSWAGGIDGREVLDRLLPRVSSLLSSKGIFYLIAIVENKPNDICDKLLASGMATAKIITQRRAKNELLMVIRSTKADLEALS